MPEGKYSYFYDYFVSLTFRLLLSIMGEEFVR